MKKIIPLLIAAVVLGTFVIIYSSVNQSAIAGRQDQYIYYNTDTRNSCVEAMDQLTNENTILVFGSSELSASDDIAYPPALYNFGNSDYNVIMVGRGTMQSLHHAITLGAVSDKISNKKVVLIVSPQWFTASHLSDVAYSSRFSEPLFARMVKNNRLSYETKRRLVDRVQSYLKTGNPEEYERVKLYDKVYVERTGSIPERLQISVWTGLTSNKQEKDFLEEIADVRVNADTERVIAKDIDYAALLERAERAGIEACTNNDLYIYDDYYTTYVEQAIEKVKGLDEGASYSVSPEYDDLELFLLVCKETEINPLVISVPVNGIWYDWLGFSQAEREDYYQKIREICGKYNVSILDFSDKEYEHYFLKDTMHLGWKGWVYFNEAVYRFYLNQDETREYPFAVKAYERYDGETTKIRLDNHISDTREAWIQTDEKKVLLKENHNGYLEGVVEGQLSGNIKLYTKGSYGAGIHSKLQMYISNKIFIGAQQLTSGTTLNDAGKYTMKTDVEGNEFNAVLLQIFDSEMNIIGNYQSMGSTGQVVGYYRNDLQDGQYTIVIKGNSNKADQAISESVFLKQGDSIDFSYTIDGFLPTQIDISNVEIWVNASAEDAL